MKTRPFAGTRFLAAALAIGAAQAAGGGAPPDRMVLPIPPLPYTNLIATTNRDSTPQLHAPLSAPPGAPNVLLILIDDAGYGQTGTFGAPIPTPALDRLAAGGLRYTRFHVTALCSPSRAALLTGRNHHSVGMGMLTNFASGYPGYDSSIPKSAAFVSQILRENGFATAAFGKWHLIPTWEMGPSGPFDHWPTGEGFDYFYGFLDAFTDQWNPELYEGTQPIVLRVPPGRRDDYTLNEALADKAIDWIQREKAATPDRPFFVYYATGALHHPLQAPKAWIAKFKGKFDMGWDRYREIVFERQKQLGVIPPDAELTPRPPEFLAWDSLPPARKIVAARLMELFAGFMAQTDHEIGRIIDAIAALDQLDNTLVLLVAGDNGASLEGGQYGIYNMWAELNGISETSAQMLGHLDAFGSATSTPAYPAEWAWAGNTPFQWGKTFASHFGGTRDPLIVYWPHRIKDAGGIRGQFHHLIDIAPTILDAAGVPEPASVDGARQKPIEGVSMVYTFDHASAADRRTTQYFEILANRAIYQDGWIAAARNDRPLWGVKPEEFGFEGHPWELYQVSRDYSERWNVAAANPGKLESLQRLFFEEARKYQVLPLGAHGFEKGRPQMRPGFDPGRTVFTYYSSPLHLYPRLAPSLINRSYTISADVEVPESGCDGVIAAEGGQGGGFSLFVKDGRLQYTYNFVSEEMTTLAAPDRLPPGPAVIGFRFEYDGGGLGKGATAALAVNGKIVAQKRIRRTVPYVFAYETFDIGDDAGSPVGNYDSPFPFQGRIRKVAVEIAPGKLAPAAQAALREGERVAAAVNE